MGAPAVLVIPAQLIVLLPRRRRARLRPFALALASIALLCVPLLVLAVRRGSGQLFWVPRPTRKLEVQVLQSLTSAGLQATGSHHAHGLHSPYWWLRCMVGPHNDSNPAVEAYHKMLVWDIVKGPFVTRAADRVLSPLIGKSLVLYLTKPARARAA